MAHALVIGYGRIGRTLVARLRKANFDIVGIVRRDGLCDEGGELKGPINLEVLNSIPRTDISQTIVFIAIPTVNGGEEARRYMRLALDAGLKVVTCEKGALADGFEEFRPFLDTRLGYRATVGGGTQFLPALRERLSGRRDVVVHAVLNGTLNFLLHSMQHDGDSLGTAVRKAIDLGYAEPGAKNNLDVVNAEMRDTVMKTAIVYSACMGGSSLSASSIKLQELGKPELARISHEFAVRRYVVSFFPPECENGAVMDVVGGFSVEKDGWHIRAGFQRVDLDPIFNGRLPAKEDNGIITVEGAQGGEDGIYVVARGPGAGRFPTTASMLSDARKLLAV